MDRNMLRRLLDPFKRALLMDQRLTREELHQLIELSEAIIEYGRMIQAYSESSTPYAMVEIPELATRFRETPRNIKDALELLGEMGRADPSHLRGCWRLRLADTLRSEEDDKRDAGVA